jgi:seryl-tRNA synthetase
MLDIKYIRENLDAVRNAAKVKRVNVDLDKLIAVDDQRRELITKSETIRAEKNKASGEIPKMTNGPEKQALLDKMKSYSEEEKVLNDELKLIETEFTALMLLVPAVPSDKAPIGKDDTENVELYKVGTPTVFKDFEPKDHATLGEELDIIDIPRGVKIA